MTSSAWLGLILIAGIAAFAVYAYRKRRPGESFEHAYERILNTDDHKARERERQAGLRGDSEADPPPK